MLRRGNIGTFAALGLLAEVVAFAIVADKIGLGSAILLTLLSGFLGLAMLRRSGASALTSLRTMAGRPFDREAALADGLLGAVGAILLIIPGFITDLIGLCLLAPSGRRWVLARLGATAARPGRRPRGTGTIDLEAEDWTRVDTLRSP